MYYVDILRNRYPDLFYPMDIKHIIIWFIIIIILLSSIFLILIKINKEIIKIIYRKFRKTEEGRLRAEYEFIYGDRTKWPDQIILEFEKKWKKIQEKYKKGI